MKKRDPKKWMMEVGALIIGHWMRTTNLNVVEEIRNLVVKYIGDITRYPFMGSLAWSASNTPTPDRVKRILQKSRAIGSVKDNLTVYEQAVYLEMMRWSSTGDRGSIYDEVLADHRLKQTLGQ